MAVKNRLKYWRHQFQMNQTEFAKFLDILPNQYNRYEHQVVQPTLETALRIAHKIQQPIEEVFYLEDNSRG